jgi:hypothetical protein
MTLIACTCPHCGGEVKMEDTLASGYCTYCGRQIINDKAVVGDIKVKVDRASEVENILRLAKYSMYDEDLEGARALLNKAMQMDTEIADIWYMDAVFDQKNAKKDVERAKRLKSLGVFTEEDMNSYKVLTRSGGQGFFMAAVMIAFFVTFFSIPIAVIFDKFYLIFICFFAGMILIAVSVANMNKIKKSKIPIPSPRDENRIIENAVKNEVTEKKKEE